MKLEFILNNARVCLPDIAEDMLLVDLLRTVLGLTGTKRGCETGACGACSVLVDDKLTKACRTPATKVAGRAVTTIEGLHAPDGGLNDLQQAFLECGAVQCGYCTPGMIIAAEALLRANPSPTRDAIRRAIAPNLCRCTGYQQIVDAVELTAKRRISESANERIGEFQNLKSKIENLKYVGNPKVQNVDGPDKVSGRAKYVGDMRVAGMLYAKVLRSSVPHARIVKLDTAPALAVPGVKAVITHADFVDHGNFGWPVKDNYILAWGKVRFVGEGIAAVAAETEAAAQAGIDAIVLELEPLPVVSDMTRALDADAPMIPDRPVTLTAGGVGEGNLCDRHIVRNGDPAPLLAACPVVLDEVYTFPHQEHAYIETEGALAIPEPDGGVMLYANNQSPFINRDNAAKVLGLPTSLVRVIQPPVGGAFGGKDDTLYQMTAQAAKLALLAGRPVRLLLSRAESMAASYKRQASRIHLILGAEADGTLQAAKAEVLMDSGAYASMTPLASWRATMHAAGAYRYRAVHVDTTAVYTNNGFSGAFRGFGNVQAGAAVEMALDELAYRLGRDPLDFRLQNCLREGDCTMTGDPIDHEVGLTACLERVREASGWDQKRVAYAHQPVDAVRRKGIGVACYFHGSGLGGEGHDFAVATLAVDPDGGITLTSGLTDYGQGSRTVFSLLAAEILDVDMRRMRILRPDTHTAVDSGATVASRASIVGGNAVRVAAEKLRQQLTFAAADALHCAPEQLVCDGERFIGPDEEPLTFEAVTAHARAMGLPLSVEGRWEIRPIHWDFEKGTGEPYFCYVFGALVAEVEVTARTGKIAVTGMWAAHDAGRILYPAGALGQLYGGVAQGLGYALTEHFRFENAVPQTLELNTYHIPRATDVPDIDATYIQTTLREGPFGAKNLAEPVMVGAAPAIANAVFQATGQRVRALPVSVRTD
ncbi:MAG TPA: molybdopterin-dependent oxidoreductase [Anaerolineae bacterium]|nr:molybdopterin-dependent oxidoreductase [Anaerolineae bacterium]HQH38611.1 molybdopterin-dependent oxidoreductase [Anaerolineae bacterium]